MVEEKLTEDNRSVKTCTSKEMDAAKAECEEEYLECAFILSADRNWFGKLIEDLENSNIQGDCQYPTKLTAAYTLLLHWKQDSVLFNTVGNESSGQKRDISTVTCYICKNKGHYADKCPENENSGSQGKVNLQTNNVNEKTDQTGHVHFQQGAEYCKCTEDTLTTSFTFCTIGTKENKDYMVNTINHNNHFEGICQLQTKKLSSSWIMLDNGSTIDVFNNPKLLTNIRTTDSTMTIRCNAGVSYELLMTC
jgi:hypothetical protein